MISWLSDLFVLNSPEHATALTAWMNFAADIGIWTAFIAIPCVAIYFAWQRKDLPFRRTFLLFGAFIALSGVTHLIQALLFWWPAYALAGYLKLMTAVVSLITVIALVKAAPMLFSALSHSEQRFQDIFTQAAVGVAEVDLSGRWLRVNRRVSDIVGYEPEELLNLTFQDITHPDDLQKDLDQLNKLLNGEIESYSIEKRYIRKDQTIVWINLTVSHVRATETSPAYFISIIEDIHDRKQALDALAFQLKLSKTITDNATTAIFMMDDKSYCTFMNPAAEAMVGYTFSEAKGRLLHDLIHHTRPDGSHYPIQECPLDRALPERFVVHQHEDLFFRKNGESFPVQCNARPIVEGTRQVGTVIEVVDMTRQKLEAARLSENQKLLRQQEERLQLAAKATGVGIFDYDPATDEQVLDQTALDIWGLSPGSDTSWNALLNSVHPEDRELVLKTSRSWLSPENEGKTIDLEHRVVLQNGEVRWIVSYAKTFFSDDDSRRPLRSIGTMIDITERRKMEEKLRENAAALSEANQKKNDFIATLAHELRNPLAPIRSGLELMKITDYEPDTWREIRETIERQVNQLSILVDDLLDFSRITTGKLKLRKRQISLSDAMNASLEATGPLIAEAGHQIEVRLPDRPVTVFADHNRLVQVFTNLIHNAVKYTPEGGQIGFFADRQDREVIVSVRDNGVGIPPEMQEQIFDMFVQVDRPLEQNYMGLGIGLTLVSTIINSHDGKIEVHSEGEGKGSEFRVVLQAFEEPSEEVPAEGMDAELSSSMIEKKVLVVDDNRAAAKMLSLLVEALGCEVRSAADGEEAVRVASEFRPDVVFMDIGMPKMNGCEAAIRIRENSWGRDMVLVALTGWGQDEDRRQTREAGFDHHLTKPAEPSELRNILFDTKSGAEA